MVSATREPVMDFKITYEDHEEIHETMKSVMYSLRQSIGYWNNFYPETELVVKLTKIPPKTDTIAINIQEEVKTDDTVS